MEVAEVAAIYHHILYKIIHKGDMREVEHLIMVIVEVRAIVALIVIIKISLRRLVTFALAVTVLAVSLETMALSQAMEAAVTRKDAQHVAMNTGAPHSTAMRPAESVTEEDIKSINHDLFNYVNKVFNGDAPQKEKETISLLDKD